MHRYEIIFDGGALGNPGRGYGSYVITGADEYHVHDRLSYDHLGDAVTNNQAEYLTLIAALDRVIADLGPDAPDAHISILGDSQLVINQVTGKWKVRNADLRPLHAAALDRLAIFKHAALAWHPRARSVAVLGH